MRWRKPTKKPRNTGIRFVKVYDGIEIENKIIGSPPKLTNERLKDLKAHPDRYQWRVKNEDLLLDLPKIHIETLPEPQTTQLKTCETEVDIIATVTYTYTTKKNVKPQMHGLTKFLLVILAWSIFSTICGAFTLSNMADRAKIESQCYYYYKNGKPSTVEIDGVVYNLNEDGTMYWESKEFLNPWHREILYEGACVKIQTE